VGSDTISKLKDIITEHYDIGELCDYKQLHRGYCNISYVVWTLVDDDKKKHFLRRYKRGIKAKEIEFEHSIINHLVRKGFTLVAGVVRTRDGKTYVERLEGGESVFYALFDFLPGEDRYTWVSPACSQDELADAAGVLARFHDTVFNLLPQGKRYEPRIVDLLPTIAANAQKCAGRTKGTVFDAYLLENLAALEKSLQRTARALDERTYKDIPQQVIHCDYHPGNLKFQKGDITGLFDFDWSKIGARCFDVALALTYFCARWPGEEPGALDLGKVAVFLRAYQDALKGTRGPGPLSDVELECLPHMISASNLYVLNWTIEDFYARAADPGEYLIYLRHGIHFIRWLENEDNWNALQDTLDSRTCSGRPSKGDFCGSL
jgi:homoserine kinase type II